jgi:hypothetical protein
MRSGIAGINIVSAYITMVATRLNTASTFQAYDGIFIGGAAAAEVDLLVPVTSILLVDILLFFYSSDMWCCMMTFFNVITINIKIKSEVIPNIL